jgi:valyl-tRNA synthetase
VAPEATRIENSNDSIVVATTRPETMLGDVAVAVHPTTSATRT